MARASRTLLLSVFFVAACSPAESADRPEYCGVIAGGGMYMSNVMQCDFPDGIRCYTTNEGGMWCYGHK